MSSIRKWYIAGTQSEPPVNADGSIIAFNFDKGSSQVIAIGGGEDNDGVVDYEFVRENADAILAYAKQYGLSIGVPFKETVEDKQGVMTVWDAYLDLSDGAEFTKDINISRIVAKTKERLGPDWLEDKVKAITYQYLFDQGVITTNDFEYMPYVISNIPDYINASIMLGSIVTTALFVADQTQTLIEYAMSSANPFEFTSVLKIAARVLFIIVQILILFKMILNFIDLLIQDVKFHACMFEKRLLEISVNYFQYTLQTTLYDDLDIAKSIILPTKNALDIKSGDLGIIGTLLGFDIFGFSKPTVEQKGYEVISVADFLNVLKQKYKHKIILTEAHEFLFVREDVFTTLPTYTLPDLYAPTYTYNSEDLKSNYVLAFTTDSGDRNTLQNYLGTIYQVVTKHISVPFADLDLTKGLEEVTLSYALATTKTGLTLPEKMMKLFLELFSPILNLLIDAVNIAIKAVNAIKSIVNGIIKALKIIGIKIHFQFKPTSPIANLDPGASIENRIGMLLLESDFVYVPKMFLMDKGSQAKFNKIAANNRTILSAKNLYLQYHDPVVSFLPTVNRPTGNQFKILELQGFPFDSADYRLIRYNNLITAYGKQSIVKNGKWYQFPGEADMKIYVPEIFEPNLEQVFIEPDGK